jgi:3-(3-hydroxy-phenyl)propionate hydroxylase
MNDADLEHRDVVIVGAGPVGLSLALGLAQRGVDVLVLEKERSTAEHSRAPAIWPGTQEIFSELGVIGTFLDHGILLPRVEAWDVDRERMLFKLPIEELRDETDYPQLLVLPQSETERLLHEAFRAESGSGARFGSEVVGLHQDASGVEIRYDSGAGEKRVRARFAVGCDGAGSTVRESLGASFDGFTYSVRAALADVRLHEDGDFRFPRVSTRAKIAIGIRIDPELWRLILPFAGRDDRTLDERIDDAVRALFPPGGYDVVWKSDFRLHRRMSSRWVDRRIVLAGDAAHLNSPVGGQGMNAGIRDTVLLSEALVEALENDDASPLARYAERRRRELKAGVQRHTHRLTRILLVGGGAGFRAAWGVMRLLLRIPSLRRRFLRRTAMLER